MALELFLLDVLIAYFIDLIFGDPQWFPHPVRFIGWSIKKTEKFLRNIIKPKKTNTVELSSKEDVRGFSIIAKREKKAGIVLTAYVVATVFLICYLILKVAAYINPILFHIINIYLIYSSLAAKCLADEAYKVYFTLKGGDIIQARTQLSYLVGRETKSLSEKEVTKAVVETTAENTVDGVVSPLVYAFIGSFFGLGAPVVYAFKAISTLDSMVGYMNEKYKNFGWASAKLDDLANFIPARLTALLIPVSAFLNGKNLKKSFCIMLRDRRNHKSPNSAHPEAAVAGALGIQLGGPAVYFGTIVDKPTIGDADRKLEVNDINATIRLMYTTSFLTVALGVIISLVVLLALIS